MVGINMSLPRVVISTDGACSPNPGNGGWAAVIRHENGTVMEISGAEYDTANNRMEFRAIIEALKCIVAPSSITIRTDSYVAICWANRSWLNGKGYKKLPWLPSLLAEYWEAKKGHEITLIQIKGHAGDVDNDRADYLSILQTMSIGGLGASPPHGPRCFDSPAAEAS